MRLKSESQAAGEDGETLTDFWLVDNMYTFENVGFSNTVGTIKYLICADFGQIDLDLSFKVTLTVIFKLITKRYRSIYGISEYVYISSVA